MGLFSKKTAKATNEPFNPFIGNNAAGPIDVTPVAVSSTDSTDQPEEVAKPVDNVAAATEIAVEEPVATEIPVMSNDETSVTPVADTAVVEPSPELSDVEKPVEENAVAGMAAAVAADEASEPVAAEAITTDEVVAEPPSPTLEPTEESIIDSINAGAPVVTEESLAAAAEETDSEPTDVATDAEVVDDISTSEPPVEEESLIPADSVIDDSVVEEAADTASEESNPEFTTPEKKPKSKVVLLVIAALVCVGLAGVSAVLYLKWQDQQALTLDKEAQINSLTQQLTDQKSVSTGVDQLNGEVETLKEENRTLNADKLKLEENNKTLTEENNRLKTQNEELQAQVTGGSQTPTQ